MISNISAPIGKEIVTLRTVSVNIRSGKCRLRIHALLDDGSLFITAEDHNYLGPPLNLNLPFLRNRFLIGKMMVKNVQGKETPDEESTCG